MMADVCFYDGMYAEIGMCARKDGGSFDRLYIKEEGGKVNEIVKVILLGILTTIVAVINKVGES